MLRMLNAGMICCLALCSTLWADEVILKNGDRLTGSVTKSDGKTLVLKTEFMGDVTIQWPAIDSVASTQTLHVVTTTKTVAGAVKTSDGILAVTTAPGEVITVPKAEVTALRSDQEQAAYEKTLHPTLFQGWNGGANVGFALTRGNSETKNLAIAFTADRKTTHDEIAMYTNTVYATNDAPIKRGNQLSRSPTIAAVAPAIAASARNLRRSGYRFFGMIFEDGTFAGF